MALADTTSLPHVTVLLATYNGMRWLNQQLSSILHQKDVEVNIIALDDESSDGTYDWLVEQATGEPRLTVLPRQGSSGSSAANFYRLITFAAKKLDPGSTRLFAFADQDDVWHPGKLARHARLLAEGGYAGVSSSVTSFTPDGKTALVRKDFPQRQLDYIFESPGPGSTFLITAELLRTTADRLGVSEWAPRVEFHDSLVYALARGRGMPWLIDGEPTVNYRQHDDNVMGSNIGVSSALARLKLIREHWLRNHAIVLAQTALEVASNDTRPALTDILTLLTTSGISARFTLSKLAPKLRRRPRDQTIVRLLIAAGVW
jgi:rhamnosyltransferase